MDEGDEVLAFVHQVNLMLLQLLVEQRLFYLQNELCLGVELGCVGQHCCSGSSVLLVMIQCAVTGMILNQNGKAVLDKLPDGFGTACNAVLTVHDFFWNSDYHTFFMDLSEYAWL